MWLVLPPSLTSCPCAPESADSTSDSPPLSNSAASALASSATWSGKPVPPPSWQRAWKKDRWTRLLSGATCEPSTAARGVESWTASLRATRASRSATRACAWATTIRATSGRGSITPSARSGPGLSSWKTWQRTFVWASAPCAEISKEEVTAFRQDYSRRLKSAQATGVNDSSSWPTCRANEANGGGYQNDRHDPSKPRLTLTGRAQVWPTPTSGIAERGSADHRQYSRKNGANLNNLAGTWGTPRVTTNGGLSSAAEDNGKSRLEDQASYRTTPQAHDVTERGAGQQPCSKAGNACLARDARMWPTPTAQDSEQSGSAKANHVTLHRSASDWATPQARDWRSGEASQATAEKNSRPLSEQVTSFLLPAPEMTAGRPSSKPGPTSRQRLNPAFVCWLMGLPWWWTNPAPTSFAPPAMASFRSALRTRLSLLHGGLD